MRQPRPVRVERIAPDDLLLELDPLPQSEPVDVGVQVGEHLVAAGEVGVSGAREVLVLRRVSRADDVGGVVDPCGRCRRRGRGLELVVGDAGVLECLRHAVARVARADDAVAALAHGRAAGWGGDRPPALASRGADGCGASALGGRCGRGPRRGSPGSRARARGRRAARRSSASRARPASARAGGAAGRRRSVRVKCCFAGTPGAGDRRVGRHVDGEAEDLAASLQADRGLPVAGDRDRLGRAVDAVARARSRSTTSPPPCHAVAFSQAGSSAALRRIDPHGGVDLAVRLRAARRGA